jgi:hypothetical protein
MPPLLVQTAVLPFNPTDQTGTAYGKTKQHMNSIVLSDLRICRFILFVGLFIVCFNSFGQARLVLNGANITISQGAYLVIDNPSSDAITRIDGHIISEGENNILKWNIGTTIGTYIVPWGYDVSNYIPLTFTKQAGTGSGHFIFSTYRTGWQNSSQLPTGVANINGATGADNSAFVSDRFWQINATGYTARPALTNLSFNYLDDEITEPDNTITESGLIAKRYNSSLSSWNDNILASSINTTSNVVTVSSVDAANLHPWWILGTQGEVRYWVAPSNSTSDLSANWSLTAGGPGNAGVPTSLDAVIFDGTSDANCALSSNLTAAAFTVNSGFTGTITQGINTMTISSSATFGGGTFVGGTADISVGSLSLSGTSFTSTASVLDIKGDMNILGGSFIHNNGSVRFSGTSSSQQITGNTTTFRNISVTNTAADPGLTIASNQNLSGVLTVASNAVVDADGPANTSVFTLLSTTDNPTQDAAIDVLPAGARVDGDVRVQRFMLKEGGTSTRIYRYISSPVQTASVSDIQSEIPITGSFTGTSNCSGCGSAASMFYYNESVTTDVNSSGTADFNDGYVGFPDVSNTETLAPGTGYTMFVRGNVLTSTSWDVTGPINAGNVSPIAFPVTYTNSGTLVNDGWNLIGNPFPSTIDWNAASGWIKTNVTGSIYITDNGTTGTTQYATWNGTTGTNNGSRYIASGQGFWVKADGGGVPVLSANENVKAPGTQTQFFRDEPLADHLRITLSKGSVRDEAIVHFRDDASIGYDDTDALKLPNSTFNLSTLSSDGRKMAINSTGAMTCATEVSMTIENIAAGSYSLQFTDVETFSDHAVITLHDKFLSKTFDVRSGAYNFSVTSNPATYGPGRFKVSFAHPVVKDDFTVATPSVCEGSTAALSINSSQAGVTYLLKTQSGYSSAEVEGNGGEIELSINTAGLSPGEHMVTVEAYWQSCSEKITKLAPVMIEETKEISALDGGFVCEEGTVTLQADGPEGSYYNWYEGDATVPDPNQHANVFVTGVLEKSKTYYAAIANSLGCEGERKSAVAEVIKLEDASISVNDSGDSLTSNYSEGNQWYFNGTILTNETGQAIKALASGTYRLEVTSQGCQTMDEYAYVITSVEDPANGFVTVFPNPVSDYLNVHTELSDIHKVRLVNSMGQVVDQLRVADFDGEGKFDLTTLTAGVYVVEVRTDDKLIRVKILKK